MLLVPNLYQAAYDQFNYRISSQCGAGACHVNTFYKASIWLVFGWYLAAIWLVFDIWLVFEWYLAGIWLIFDWYLAGM